MKIPDRAQYLLQYNNLTAKAAWPGMQSSGGRNTRAEQSRHENGVAPDRCHPVFLFKLGV
jgi:hypothetical protein